MQMIKAAVCHAFGTPLTIEEVRLRAPEMGEVEVKLEAVAICHSDISYAEGAYGKPVDHLLQQDERLRPLVGLELQRRRAHLEPGHAQEPDHDDGDGDEHLHHAETTLGGSHAHAPTALRARPDGSSRMQRL